MKAGGFFGLLRPLVLLTVVIIGLPPGVTGAQPVAAPAAVILPTTQLEIPPPQLRTWQEMEAAAALEAAGPPPPPRLKPFRPTMGEAAYKALKAKAAQAPAAPAITAPAPLAASALTSTINFEGVNQGAAGNFHPPDTEGAVGLNHFVEITNSHIDIYQKAAPNARVNGGGIGVPLSSFFGYTAQSLFDPRVIYDSVTARWIVSADAFPEPGTTPPVQWFFFAVSQTADPTGNFFIYKVNVSGNSSTALWDFPQIGLDQNAVIFTANFFNGNPQVFVDARMFTVAKSILYNGPSQTITPTKLFTGLAGTLSAPIVLDANPNTYLVAADIAGSSVTIYTLTNSGGNPPDPLTSSTITVPTYTAPAKAPQPGQGTTHLIDTSDARFVNAGTQIGDSLFQVHSIDNGAGHAICRFYEFDTVNKTVIQQGDFSRSSTSYDFNASIAANRHKDVFVTWSATDPTINVNAEVRFSGRLHTDPAGVIPSPGSLLFASSVALTGNSVKANPPRQDLTQRWGDYSAVSLDPADPSGATAWIVNETILTTTTWGSRIGSIRLPVKTPLPAVDLLLLGD